MECISNVTRAKKSINIYMYIYIYIIYHTHPRTKKHFRDLKSIKLIFKIKAISKVKK